MIGWRFLATPRWVGYTALVIVFAIVCHLLGAWQFARRGEAQVEISRIDANYDHEPVPLADALPALDAYDENQKWLPVLVEGRYLHEEEFIVRGRPLGGRPGFEVLTPLLLDDGSVFMVDRGWIPYAPDSTVASEPPRAPDGEVEVVARLRAGEPSIPGRTSPEGTNQLATIKLDEVAERLDRPVFEGAYGQLVRETPAADAAPLLAPKPARDEGPHLSYALQWYVFALLAFIGLGWAVRHEHRVLNADDPRVQEQAEERARRRARRAPSDADIEDALLDRSGR